MFNLLNIGCIEKLILPCSWLEWWSRGEMEVTSFITQELRNSIRFLERIFCYDELRLHAMPLGSRILFHKQFLHQWCAATIAGWPCLPAKNDHFGDVQNDGQVTLSWGTDKQIGSHAPGGSQDAWVQALVCTAPWRSQGSSGEAPPRAWGRRWRESLRTIMIANKHGELIMVQKVRMAMVIWLKSCL